MFLAAMHNGISRLYETFGNGGADTEKRILDPEEYARTWYKPNPPLPVVIWSQRNNNNYEETALLSTISFFAQNGQQFLQNYYTKSKRSIEKPRECRPGRLRVRRADIESRGGATTDAGVATCRDQQALGAVHLYAACEAG